jgi:hypothetical protein
LCVENPRQYDPKKIVESHLKSVGLVHSIQHEEIPQEDIFRGTMSFEEALLKIRDEKKRNNETVGGRKGKRDEATIRYIDHIGHHPRRGQKKGQGRKGKGEIQ